MTSRRRSWSTVAALAVMVVLLASCASSNDAQVEYYTCSMHPQIRMDTAGQCPICGMDLIPVLKKGDRHEQSHLNHSQEDSSKNEIQIDPRHVQIIGVTKEPVQTRDLTDEILTYGKVAHDQKLWLAQNEYIEALKLGDASLIKASEKKLKFMGLPDEWIDQTRRTRSADVSLHFETEGKPSFIEAYVFQNEIGNIKEGLDADILDQSGRVLTNGKVRAIGNLVDLNSRSIRVLVEIVKSTKLKLNTFVQVRFKVGLGRRLSVPKSAILFNGSRNLIYIAKENGVFEPKEIMVGEQAGEYYEIISGVAEGDMVVTNGHFLIDAETQIKLGTSEEHHH